MVEEVKERIARAISELGDEGAEMDVEVFRNSMILQFAQNENYPLHKYMLSVLSQCHARLITVRTLSHSKQPQYALDQIRGDLAAALLLESLQLSRTDRSDSTHVAAQSNH